MSICTVPLDVMGIVIGINVEQLRVCNNILVPLIVLFSRQVLVSMKTIKLNKCRCTVVNIGSKGEMGIA